MKWLFVGPVEPADFSDGERAASRPVPPPRQLTWGDGGFRFETAPSIAFSHEGVSHLFEIAAETLKDAGVGQLERGEWDRKLDSRARELWTRWELDDPEGYALVVEVGGAFVLANEAAGLFYGLQTLAGLLVKDAGAVKVGAVVVRDWPAMAVRGLSDDVSRGQSASVEATKRFVKLLAKFRLNAYFFYVEDAFAFSKHPSIGSGRGPLTPAAVRELQEFARPYNVEVVPIFQTLGHLENVLLDPRFEPLGEFAGSACLNLGDPKIYDFLGDLLEEVAAAFESAQFHAGCDESWDVGACRGKKFVEAKGLGAALRDHYLWVVKKLKSLGKRRIYLYHDVAFKHPEVLEGLPKDGSVAFVYWDYSTRGAYPKIDVIRDAGLPFVVSSSVLSWTKPFPDWKGALASNRALIDEGLRKGALGQINSSWGDNGQENLRENNLLPWAWSAAYSWNPGGWDGGGGDDAFLDAFFRAYLGLGTSDPRVARLYELLSSVWEAVPTRFRGRYLGHFWRHPYPRPALAGEDDGEEDEGGEGGDDERWEVSADLHYHEDDLLELGRLGDEVVRAVEEVRGDPRVRDSGVLDVYQFVGRLLSYFATKVQTSAKVTNLCRAGLTPERTSMVESLVGDVLKRLKDLRERFAAAWARSASRPMLDRILRFYDWQVHWQEGKLDQVRRGVAWENPYVGSEWIWHEEDELHQSPRLFRGTFHVPPGEVRRAHLQVAAGNHAEVWLNGQKLGHVTTNAHLSAPVIDHRVEFWDVTGLLREDKNVVAVEATNFFGGNPVVNAYGEVLVSDGEGGRGGRILVVKTDRSWRTSRPEGVDGDWTSPEFDDGNWPTAGSKGRPPKYFGEICKPRFEVGWKSKTTHHGWCRILQAKAAAAGPVSEFFDDFFFFSGNVV
ncbi:MAG: hypothetical protein Kow0069_08450 [Promethearchaeota archaeon]